MIYSEYEQSLSVLLPSFLLHGRILPHFIVSFVVQKHFFLSVYLFVGSGLVLVL